VGSYGGIVIDHFFDKKTGVLQSSAKDGEQFRVIATSKCDGQGYKTEYASFVRDTFGDGPKPPSTEGGNIVETTRFVPIENTKGGEAQSAELSTINALINQDVAQAVQSCPQGFIDFLKIGE
jgi:hypothetical protein